jgi:hypothetical protein
MLGSASDRELLARQAALQAEAAQVLTELDLGALFGDVGPALVVGSYVSGLMCGRDLDVVCWPAWSSRPLMSWSC